MKGTIISTSAYSGFKKKEPKKTQKGITALTHVYSVPLGAEEEVVSVTQRGNAHLKQENGTFF